MDYGLALMDFPGIKHYFIAIRHVNPVLISLVQ